MPLVNGVKFACETCIKGHRTTTCKHSDRQLVEIKKKGRPQTQCDHCRELRKVKQMHVKCLCAAAKPDHPSSAQSSSSEHPSSPQDCSKGPECPCCVPRKRPSVKRTKQAPTQPHSQPNGTISAGIFLQEPERAHGHDVEHHHHQLHNRNSDLPIFSPYERAYNLHHPLHPSSSAGASTVPCSHHWLTEDTNGSPPDAASNDGTPYLPTPSSSLSPTDQTWLEAGNPWIDIFGSVDDPFQISNDSLDDFVHHLVDAAAAAPTSMHTAASTSTTSSPSSATMIMTSEHIEATADHIDGFLFNSMQAAMAAAPPFGHNASNTPWLLFPTTPATIQTET